MTAENGNGNGELRQLLEIESAVALFAASQRVSDAGKPVWTAEEDLELVGCEATFYETS